MFREGIGENGSFAGRHPIVNLAFFVFTVGVGMFSNSPWFLAVSFACAFFYSVLLSGVKQIKTNLIFMLPIMIIMAVINTFFTHNGATVLFYLNDSRITLEALLYGISSAFLLTSVIIWFACFNVIMSADKLIYVFGKAAPVLGLTLSMIFRFIPLLKDRYKEISMGQRCMGRHAEKGLMASARTTVKETSILISWSLEAAIETSDSMEARGYGLPGRTSFHLFKMSREDKKMLAIILVSGVISLIGCAMGKTQIYYYPVVVLGDFDLMTAITFIAYSVLMITPIVEDILGERKWQTYR